MKRIINTISFLTIMAVIPAAIAATSRVSYNATKSPNRLSVVTGISGRYTGAVSVTQTSSTASLLEDYECVENYSTCLKGADVCGADMEECTTNVLFHAKMPSCLSVLAQCKASGINSLFGTSDITVLSTVKEYDSKYKDEVVRYTYPLDGSVLGQMIIGAEISNRLTTEQCVRKYMNCLKKDTVCGDQFELCTEDREFKKQALFCDSTLARCQGEGKTQLFGSTTNAKNLKPSASSRIGAAIKDGAEMAAANAVLTCQKVADACFTNACSANPWRCIEDTNLAQVTAANLVAGGETAMTVDLTGQGGDDVRNSSLYKLTGIEVRKYFKSMCLETIGSNKYCYMTFEEKTPRDKDLVDVDNQEDVFSLAYAARKETINTKLQDIAKVFDKNAKDKCVETIKSCAMRSCGGGLGSVCYSDVFGNGGKTINTGTPYEDIKLGCAAVVNTDPNCQYAATASGDGYSYNYVNQDTFTTLFPDASATTGTSANDDPIGVIASLNAALATSYNDAAIANMKKQCQTVAVSCVRSLCGSEYTNCYRNRTDIVDGSYNTGTSLDKSMNKMGGVLDYNIVMGLCMNTVKNANVCDEHLKIAANTIRRRGEVDNTSWTDSNGKKYGSVREAWQGANSTSATATTTDIVIGCRISEANADGKKCIAYSEMPDNDGSCVGVMDEDGCIYDEEVTQSYTEYTLTNAGKALFQEVLRDIEKEVQAKYNAKIVKEQNVCLANNAGGITSQGENGSTFMWVKLKSHKIPKDYETMGLQPKNFTASNDLYGSFCRARISVKSDNKDIQEVLAKEGGLNAYFAIGDAFTCGSWISSDTLEKITKKVGEQALVDEGVMVRNKKGDLENSAKTKATLAWAPVASMVGGGLLGYGVTAGIQSKGNTLGGLLKNNTLKRKNEEKRTWLQKCNDEAINAENMMNSAADETNLATRASIVSRANSYAYSALSYARRADVDVAGIEFKSMTYQSKSQTNKAYRNEDSGLPRVSALLNTFENCQDCYNDNACKNFVSIARAAYDSPTENSAGEVISNLRAAQRQKACNVNTNDLPTTTTFTTVSFDNGTSYTLGDDNFNDVVQSFGTNITKLKINCASKEYEDEDNKALSEAKINAIGTGIGAAAGLILGGGIAGTVIQVKKEEIQNEAVKQWMNEIGDHIECYVGAQFLGNYGDTVSLDID